MAEEERKRVVLHAPDLATVDDLTLEKGVVDKPFELTQDQIDRLSDHPEVDLEVLGPSEDPIDALKGEELEKAFITSGLDPKEHRSVEAKREALKAQRDNQDGGES